ncbi:redoxin domain-containing protein [Maribacter sp. 2210JD10-5]|uniref:redoxin domain-containing protein n=1 Tax=Maribacter sp. 2210JD10-5 TaxID=3386272 RepID=UPI0039BCFAE3
MKKVAFILLALLLNLNTIYAQEELVIDQNTEFRDEAGNKVSFSDAMEKYDSGDWMLDPIDDDNGKFLYVELRKATEEEKAMLAEGGFDDDSGNEFIGKASPKFSFTDSNGKAISSENTIGKVVVLNFWFATCKPCIDEVPELNEVYSKYKDNPEVVFAAITFEKKDKIDPFIKKYGFQYPTVAEAEKVCNDFGVEGYPTNIVIDKSGTVFDYTSGGFAAIGKQIESSIKKALTGQKANSGFDLEGQLLTNGYAKIPLKKLISGHLSFEGKINGIDGRFILDTGAGATVIEAKNQKKFNMKSEGAGESASGAGGGDLELRTSSSNSFEIADTALEDQTLYLMDLDHVNVAFADYGIEAVDGVLGADILEGKSAVIDYESMALYLKK